MKTYKFLKLVSLFTVLLFMTSCVEDGGFETPNINIKNPDLNPENRINFNALIQRHLDAVDVNGDGNITEEEENNAENIIGVFDLDNDTPLYIVGYVVSSDKGGNFFEELIIQNNIDGSSNSAVEGDDIRRGFKVEINARSLSDTFEFGRKIFIKMNGLAVGISNGTYVIGKPESNNVGQIQEFEYLYNPNQSQFKTFIGRFPEVETITPKIITIDELLEEDENTLVQFEDTQFIRSLIFPTTATFAGSLSDAFDGFRILESCTSNSIISLQTSTFADFKSLLLPQNRGSIQGVFTRNFNDNLNVLVVNSINDINFDNENRCDPDTLMCSTTSGGGSIFFDENFESFGGFASEGWVNINVIDAGGTDWVIGDFSSNSYAQISGFGSDENEIDVWLVSPTINMDSTTGEELNFDIQANFDNGTILSVFIATNFTGDVTTADWVQLDVNIPNGPASGFGPFTSVGPTNISCLDGDINIAFFYEGSDPSATTRYHIDNIEITGN
ncbi:MAG: DUF5689 domain-containing protein [Flavobacteriaceae bacterium]|nr:DUF5689 domain-containing protein [Flavobacteriaceae bacterium]